MVKWFSISSDTPIPTISKGTASINGSFNSSKPKAHPRPSIPEFPNLGDVYFEQKNYRKALDVYLEQLPNQQDNVALLDKIGFTYEKLEDFPNALKFFKDHLERVESASGSESEAEIAKALHSVAIVSRRVGELKEALDYDLRSLSIRKKLHADAENHIDVANSLNSCGDAFYSLGDNLTALNKFLESLSMWQRLVKSGEQAESIELAQLLNKIGVVYNRMERFEQALDFKLQALELGMKLYSADHKDVANFYNSVGVAYHRLGDFSDAIENYLKSLDMNYRLINVMRKTFHLISMF